MNIWVGAALAAVMAFVQSDRAWAQLTISSGSEFEPRLMCKAWTGDDDLMLASGEVTNQPNAEERFAYHARKYGEQIGKEIYLDCVDFTNIAPDYRASFEPGSTFKNYRDETRRVVEATFLPDNWESTPTPAEMGKNAAKRTNKPASASNAKPAKPAPAPSKYVEVAGPDGGTIRLSPEVAARNEAAAEAYRRKMEAHTQAMADHDRKLAKHQDNAAKAAAARQAHEAKLAANATEVAAHRAAMDDYQMKLAGKAATDDDPDRCITSPETKPGLRGNTEVRVTNGCDQKVDIVICLKRTTGDWLCGANFGVLSQRSMTFMSTNATGEIYVDAVTFGSKNKLGRPAGVIK